MLLTAAKAKSRIKNIAHKNNADSRVLMLNLYDGKILGKNFKVRL